MKRPVLGRGLDSLLPKHKILPNESNDINIVSDYVVLSIDDIVPNPYQPRKNFSEDSLRELAESIKTEGLIQPIVVSSIGGGKFQLIAGERRWQATRLAGLTTIRAVVDRKAAGLDQLVAALLENLQREDLDPLEEAEAFSRLAREFELSHEEIARRMGRSRAAVSNALRLLHLPAIVQEALRDRRVTVGQVRPLLGLPESDALTIFREITEKGLTARAVEERTGGGRSARRKGKSPSSGNVARADAEDRLMKTWGRAIRIVGSETKGHVRIEYYSKADLIELVERLLVTP